MPYLLLPFLLLPFLLLPFLTYCCCLTYCVYLTVASASQSSTQKLSAPDTLREKPISAIIDPKSRKLDSILSSSEPIEKWVSCTPLHYPHSVALLALLCITCTVFSSLSRCVVLTIAHSFRHSFSLLTRVLTQRQSDSAFGIARAAVLAAENARNENQRCVRNLRFWL